MTDDDFPLVLIGFGCNAVLFCGFGLIGLNIGTVTAQEETEQKTVVYCVEQPTACKTKYNYYKLKIQK